MAVTLADLAGQWAYVARERAACEAAITLEADDTLADLDRRLGFPFPDPKHPFTREHVRLLVRSAFLAGVNYQFDRTALLKDRSTAS